MKKNSLLNRKNKITVKIKKKSITNQKISAKMSKLAPKYKKAH